MFRLGCVVGAATAAAALACAASAGATAPLLTEPERIPTDGAAMNDVAVLDYNGDGWPDIALAGSRTVELILGRSDGWATPQAITLPVPATSGASQLAGGNLTDDRLNDLVVAVGGAGRVAVLRGRADGRLVAPDAADVYAVADPDGTATPAPTASIDLGDLNGDGALDVVAAFDPTDPSVSGAAVALVNDKHGALTPQPAITTVGDLADIRLVHLGGDDDLNLVATHGTYGSNPHGRLLIFPGADDATFGTPQPWTTGDGEPVALATGDVDGDRVGDVAVGLSIANGLGLSPELYFGDANAPSLLWPPVALSFGTFKPVGTSVELGDLNRDGFDDVAVATTDRGVLGLFASNGAARSFGFPDSLWLGGRTIKGWAVADADGDGKLDIVAAATGPEVDIYYGSGPRLTPQTAYVDFGEVPVESSSAPVGGTIVNRGPGIAAGLQLILAGDAGDFVLDQDGCSGATLAVGRTCSMQVRFRPTAAGDRELSAAVVAPDSTEAFWVDLEGEGIVPQPASGTTPGAVTATSAPASSLAQPAAPPPASSPPAAATLKRLGSTRLTRRGQQLRLDTGWQVHCGAGRPGCHVTVLLVQRAAAGHKAPVLARATITVPAGKTLHPVVVLTPAGRRTFGSHRSVAAVLQLSVTRTGAAPVTSRRTLKLRRPRTASR